MEVRRIHDVGLGKIHENDETLRLDSESEDRRPLFLASDYTDMTSFRDGAAIEENNDEIIFQDLLRVSFLYHEGSDTVFEIQEIFRAPFKI